VANCRPKRVRRRTRRGCGNRRSRRCRRRPCGWACRWWRPGRWSRPRPRERSCGGVAPRSPRREARRPAKTTRTSQLMAGRPGCVLRSGTGHVFRRSSSEALQNSLAGGRSPSATGPFSAVAEQKSARPPVFPVPAARRRVHSRGLGTSEPFRGRQSPLPSGLLLPHVRCVSRRGTAPPGAGSCQSLFSEAPRWARSCMSGTSPTA
jgi:hypothetical protein